MTAAESSGSSEPALLFHYTTAKGAIGIAQRKALWATNIRYLSDSTEYLHALHLVRRAYEDYPQEDLSVDERGFLSYILGGARRNTGIPYDWRGVQYYVASLSAHQDLLSQWRAYAPRGGYAIGFSATFLHKAAEINGFSLRPCIYDPVDQEGLAHGVLAHVLQDFRSRPIALDFGKLPLSELTEGQAPHVQALIDLQGRFEQSLGDIATVCKNPAFREESEWRLISASPRGPKLYREGRTVIIPYHEFALPLGESSPNPGVQIVCGPSADIALSQYSALDLFSSSGWPGVGVRRSLVPYREW